MAEMVTVSVWVKGRCNNDHMVYEEVTVRAEKGSSGTAWGSATCLTCLLTAALSGSYTA